MKLHILTIDTDSNNEPEAFATREALDARLREIIDAAIEEGIDEPYLSDIQKHLADDDIGEAWNIFREQVSLGHNYYSAHEIEVPGITALPENESFAEALVYLIERGNTHAEIRDVFTSLHRGLKG